MSNLDLLEDYPTDPRGPSALFLTYLPNKEPIHFVIGWNGQGPALIITVYRPGPPKFLDERTRAPRVVVIASAIREGEAG